MRSLKNRSETLSCKIWFLERTKISLNPKDEPSISKIERVTWIFVTGAEAKSRCCQIFKSQNLTQFLRFLPNFLHVSSISYYLDKFARSNIITHWPWANVHLEDDQAIHFWPLLWCHAVIFLYSSLHSTKIKGCSVPRGNNKHM